MARILVGTRKGVFSLGDEEDTALEGLFVPHLISGPGGIWAAAEEEVRRSADGSSWETVAEMPGRPNCVLPLSEGKALVGAEDARLFRISDGSVSSVTGFDEAEGRDSWYTPWGGPADVRSMSRAGGGPIYLNVHVGGILASEDGGENWKTTGIDIDSDVHQVLAHDDLLLAATARGLALSEDGGESWVFDASGLHASYCRAVAVAADNILITASTGPHGGRAALYRKKTGATGFEKCAGGLPDFFQGNLDTHCLHAHQEAVAVVSEDGDVFFSEDAGDSFERVAEGLPEPHCLLI